MRRIRVLVVDDSAFIRFTLAKRLNDEPDIEVVGTARDGVEAVEKVEELDPDVVTLDIQMPRLNGLGALSRIMRRFPRPIIMLSTLTQNGARETLKALSLGAVDFVPKPSSAIRVPHVLEDLRNKIRAVAHLPAARLHRPSSPFTMPPKAPPEAALVRRFARDDVLVVLGASTGGPRALSTLVSGLPPKLEAAIAIVQHMPKHFTASLAERLDSLSAFHIKEATASDKLRVGQGLLAPGGQHLCFQRLGAVRLSDAPPRNHVRPAVDVTLETAARWYGPSTVAVILTGMGRDGTAGAKRIKAQGGMVLAEAEATCVVYGMPKCVVEAGIADQVVPIGAMAAAVADAVEAVRCQKNRARC